MQALRPSLIDLTAGSVNFMHACFGILILVFKSSVNSRHPWQMKFWEGSKHLPSERHTEKFLRTPGPPLCRRVARIVSDLRPLYFGLQQSKHNLEGNHKLHELSNEQGFDRPDQVSLDRHRPLYLRAGLQRQSLGELRFLHGVRLRSTVPAREVVHSMARVSAWQAYARKSRLAVASYRTLLP
jgi:hypothetical protein